MQLPRKLATIVIVAGFCVTLFIAAQHARLQAVVSSTQKSSTISEQTISVVANRTTMSTVVRTALTSARPQLVLASVVLDEIAGKRFREGLSGSLVTGSPSIHCVAKSLRKVEYTHRRQRPGEFSTLHFRDAARLASSSFWEESSQFEFGRLVAEPPIVFTPDIDLSRPFGSWHVRYFPSDDILTGRRTAQPPQVIEIEPLTYVAVLSPGVSSHGNSISCNGTTVSGGGCLWDVRNPNPLPWNEAKPITVVTLCDEWCKGYYHFSHEHLPRIAPVYELLARGEATLALSHRMNGFQKQFFVDILGIPKIVEAKVLAASHVLHPTPMRCGNTFTLMLHRFREIVFRRLSLEPSRRAHQNRTLRLLFAERGKGSRMASNYGVIKSAVIASLKQHEVLFATTRGTEHARDQVRSFYAADIVLGPHGANLANIMFMQRGGHVIEMASLLKGNMCYYTTSVRVGLSFHFIPHLKGKDDSYVLDPDVVVKHVEHAIAQLRAT